MLVIQRKLQESIYIGDDIKLTVTEIRFHTVKIGIEAPRHLSIWRDEIYKRIQHENAIALQKERIAYAK